MDSQQTMPAGQSYFDIPLHNQYIPDSPDTFYANIPPPASDSAHTPPEPISSARHRRSTGSHSNHANGSNNGLRRSTTVTSASSYSVSGPTAQFRKERERQLANTPRDSLIHLAVTKEHEIKEAKHLLTTAILQIESLRDKLAREEQSRKVLEEEKRLQGLKTTQAILKAQRESMGALESVGTYKLQIENMQRELKRAREVVRSLEGERDDVDRALVRARTAARQMKETNVLLQAREEGRRQGFEEGLRQGRIALAPEVSTNPGGDREAPIEEETPKPSKRSPKDSRKRPSENESRRMSGLPSQPPNPAHSLEVEAARDALREINEREALRVKMQLHELEKDLDRERQKNKESSLALETLKKRAEEDRIRAEQERDRDRREKEEIKRREEDRVRHIEDEKRRLEEVKEREIRELKDRLEREKEELENRAKADLERERSRLQRVEEDRAREHEREREREEERKRKEKGKEKETNAAIAAAAAAAAAAAVEATVHRDNAPTPTPSALDGPPFAPQKFQPLPYMPMPPPPGMPMPAGPSTSTTKTTTPAPAFPTNPNPYTNPRNTFGVPRAPSSSSQRGYGAGGGGGGGGGGGRRNSVADSYSSASTMPFDMLQFPNDRERERDRDQLSVIPEDASVRDMSPMRNGTPMRAGGSSTPVPSWITNPPVDHAWAEKNGSVEGWRSSVGHGMPEFPPRGVSPGPLGSDARGGGGGNSGGGPRLGNGVPRDLHIPRGPYGNPNHANHSNPDLLSPGIPGLERRSSSGSNGSYEIHVEPPSGPPSNMDPQEQMQDPSGDFLTPRHIPSPLPHQPQQQQRQPQQHQPQQHHQPRQHQQMPILPVRPRGGQYDTSGVPTAPNSPVVLNGPLPSGFIPQMLTDSHGVSTPFSRSAGLPGMGNTHGGMTTPVIPGNPPPVFPSSGPPVIPTAGPGPIYGNPLAKNRDRDREEQSQSHQQQRNHQPQASPAWNNKPFFSPVASPGWTNKPLGTPGGGAASPLPSWGASSPSAWGNNNNNFGAPGTSNSANGGGMSSPAAWGTANEPFIPPGVSGSSGSAGFGAGGMTPAPAPRDLPGFAGSGTGSFVGRSGVSIYGPPVGGGGGPSAPAPTGTGFVGPGFNGPSSPMMMPQPTVPTYGDDEDDGPDRFDPTTEENTRLNAAVVVDVPSSSAPVKKTRKKKR